MSDPVPRLAHYSETSDAAPVSLDRILIALDASDHANRALEEAVRLAATSRGVVTGIHAYAARLHDRGCRQKEGGLLERYRKETEMERQCIVHDDLITRGPGIISDSYDDTAMPLCEQAGVTEATRDEEKTRASRRTSLEDRT